VIVSNVISRDGTSIAYSRTGEGPAVILVDGALAHRAINPTALLVAALLAPQFSVYTYDRRGRGDSGDTAPYSVEREADDLEAIIAHHSDGEAHVFGWSSGALLALDAAAHGLQVQTLAVYEPPLLVDGSHPPLSPDFLSRITELVSADRRREAVELYFTDALNVPADALAAMHRGLVWREWEKVAPTLVYDGTLFHDTLGGTTLAANRWRSVTIPTLVIDGEASRATMHAGAEALAQLLPNARRCTLVGQTHDVAAEILAPVLAAFFAHVME
jgi:pimeloyl-ACP methyl ester carboxylesterase